MSEARTTETSTPWQEQDWRRLFPWTILFRASRIALDPRKLLLAALALVALSFWWGLLALVFVPNRPQDPSSKEYRDWYNTWAQKVQLGTWPGYADDRGQNPYLVVSEAPGRLWTYDFWRTQGPVLMEPFRHILRPVTMFFETSPWQRDWWFLLFGLLGSLAIWGFFAGAITRLACIEFAKRDRIGFKEGLLFACKRYLHFLGAPVFPIVGVGVMVVVMVLGAFFILIVPWLGDVLGGLLGFLPLLGGLLMVLLLAVYLAWPLMYASISTEGGDTLDALSRSYAYLFSRPWRYLFYWMVALVYGTLVVFVAVLAVSLIAYLSKWALDKAWFPQFRYEGNPVANLYYFAPTSYEWDRLLMGSDLTTPEARERLWENMSPAAKLGAVLNGIWLHGLFLLMIGYAYSYFWSVSTGVYLLMRQAVDETDLEEVYQEEEEESAAESTGMTTMPLTQPESASPPGPEAVAAESQPSQGAGQPPSPPATSP
ncbi:MAG: hypothetical protein C4296_03390 [Gemmataceae bacterium]